MNFNFLSAGGLRLVDLLIEIARPVTNSPFDTATVSGTHSIVLTLSDDTGTCLFPQLLSDPNRAISIVDRALMPYRY